MAWLLMPPILQPAVPVQCLYAGELKQVDEKNTSQLYHIITKVAGYYSHDTNRMMSVMHLKCSFILLRNLDYSYRLCMQVTFHD